MSLFELLFIALGLSMDAFAVAVTIGLSVKKINFNKALLVGLYFGLFQAIMPLIGFFVGSRFADKVSNYDHWIAFLLLAFIGSKMLVDSISKQSETPKEMSLVLRTMLPLAVATSIDALAVGVSFSFFSIPIAPASFLIGMITLLLSMLGVKIGQLCGLKFKSKAEFAGGVILILIGLKILLEHLGLFL